MEIRIEQDKKYTIKQLTRTFYRGENQIAWKYVEGSHFLVAVTPGIREWNLTKESSFAQMAAEAVEDGTAQGGDVQMYGISEEAFRADGKKFVLDRRKIKGNMPYRIQVFPCQMGHEVLTVYQVDEQESVTAIPFAVTPEIDYRKSWGIVGPQKCILKIPSITNYVDGMLCYRPSCSRMLFPIPESALGRELYIDIPKGESLDVVAAEEYRKYIKIQ